MQVLNSGDFPSHGHHKFIPTADRFLTGKRLSSSGLAQAHKPTAQSTLNKANGLEVFQSTLVQRYQKFSTQAVVPVEKPENQRLSAETVANNILGFIEQRLRKDAKEGASSEELSQRLEEGLAGFKKGFAEAKEKIEALGLLSAEVEDDIGKTYDLVTDGIKDLRERFVEGLNDKSSLEKSDKSEKVANLGNKVKGLTASYGQVSYAQMNALKFEVETADGDVVSISARSKELYAAEYRAGSYNTGNAAGAFEQFSSRSEQSSRFEFSVNGELDEDEMRAIDQLLNKVEDLSADFFAGDLDSAFNQALNLGYDSEEIVGYSLNLRQVEVQRVAAAYQQVGYQPVGNAQTPAINPLAERLQPLGDFAKNLLDGLDIASPFADAGSLIANLSEQFDLNRAEALGEQDNNRFGRFVNTMLDSLPNQSEK